MKEGVIAKAKWFSGSLAIVELHSSSSFSLIAKRSCSFAKELAWVVKISSSVLAILLWASAPSFLPAELGCSIMFAITSSRLELLVCACVPVWWRSARKWQVESLDVINWL